MVGLDALQAKPIVLLHRSTHSTHSSLTRASYAAITTKREIVAIERHKDISATTRTSERERQQANVGARVMTPQPHKKATCLYTRVLVPRSSSFLRPSAASGCWLLSLSALPLAYACAFCLSVATIMFRTEDTAPPYAAGFGQPAQPALGVVAPLPPAAAVASAAVGAPFNLAEFVREYQLSLADLTFNSKPIINSLTLIADENKAAAPQVVAAIEERIRTVRYRICFV